MNTENITDDFVSAANALEHWVVNSALPLWSRLGFDRDTGGHIERLTELGVPDRLCNIRLRVQARQSFVFAYAKHLGWFRHDNRESKRLLQFVDGHRTGDNYPHLLNSEYQVIDSQASLYDYAFHILANTWQFKSYGEQAALDRAQALVRHIDVKFGSEFGGWLEGDRTSVYRQQNPHMHLLEAFLALHSATNNSYWLNRCAQIIDLFSCHFFDAQHGVLLENFNENWSPLPDLDKNNIVEPGHMLEWVWLIGQYSCQSGIDMKATMLELYNSALKIGVSSSGLINDAVTIDGSPLLRTKRCWPMTEYIKASVSIAELGLELGLTEGTKAIHKLMKYYFKENLAGTYIDQLDADDQVISAVSPASTLYHIVVAAGEAARLRNALLLRTYQENTNFVQL